MGPCGNCVAPIGKGDVYLLTRHRAIRCAPCATRMFEVEVPEVVEEDAPIPQPALLAPPPKDSHGFVSVGYAGRARSVRDVVALATRDFRKRQSGDD
jgi:hypothetical protein